MTKPINNPFRLFKRSSLFLLISASLTPLSANAVLEEVIVTANKRAESANDIGLSIAAISGDKLAEQKLTSIEEITSSIPGLTFASSQQGTPILTLRGVGFNESSLGVYPATSLYVDEIPLPFPVMASHSSYDLERAEVLKGPQGVLFGQNSTGGAINFVAAKPTQELTFGGDFSYGRFNKMEGNGFISGGLTDTVSARIAVQTVQADDWQKSLTTNRENGEEDYTAARLSLRFEPSDSTEINVNINGWTDKSDPQALQFVAAVPKRFDQAAASSARQFAAPFTKNNARSADWSFEQSGDKEFIQASVRGDFDLSDTLTLTALAAYSDYEQNQAQDGDGYTLSTADFLHNEGEIDSTFLEIRLAGDLESLRWVIGANYEDSNTHEDQLLQLLDNTSSRPQTFFINRTGADLEQKIESYAFFTNVDVDVAEFLTLKVGARYTDTEIVAANCNYSPINSPDAPDASGNTATPVDAGSNVAAFFNFLPSATGNTTPFTPIGVGDCFTTNENSVPGDVFNDTLSEDNVSWRIGLDWRVNDDALTYLNISQGYKAGSYPTLAALNFSQLQPVVQESVLAYEAGFKLSMVENTVQWNGAIFYYDYEDKQVRGKADLPIFKTLDTLVNVPESTIKGIETDIVAQLTEELTFSASVTYLDSNVDKYGPADDAYDVFGNLRDFSGNSLPLTPEFTYSFDLDYRTPLEQGGTLFMGLNVTGQSDSDAAFDGDDLTLDDSPVNAGAGSNGIDAGFHKSITDNYLVIESYHTVGARIGFESTDSNWRVMLWGKNLTDEYYWNSVISSSESGARVAGRPRTYGITVGYTY